MEPYAATLVSKGRKRSREEDGDSESTIQSDPKHRSAGTALARQMRWTSGQVVTGSESAPRSSDQSAVGPTPPAPHTSPEYIYDSRDGWESSAAFSIPQSDVAAAQYDLLQSSANHDFSRLPGYGFFGGNGMIDMFAADSLLGDLLNGLNGGAGPMAEDATMK